LIKILRRIDCRKNQEKLTGNTKIERNYGEVIVKKSEMLNSKDIDAILDVNQKTVRLREGRKTEWNENILPLQANFTICSQCIY
jgi:hypothetical protein